VPSTQHQPETDWQPATSEPGELFTIEGRIRAAGAFARGLHSRDPRLVAYRRSMRRVGAAVIAVGAFIAVVAALLF
jgi:roadblock/LC7 domain-containing protein